MAPRGSSLFPEHEDEDELTMTGTTAVPTEPDTQSLIAEDPEGDLISRTRRSMAGFDKAKQKAQLERRRSQRRSKLPPPRIETSQFPAVDEDTTQDQSVLAEELMAEEDMEAVFRSRPKIKASPMPSPTKLDFDDEYA